MKTVKKGIALLLVLLLAASVAPMEAMATLWSGGGEGNSSSAYLDLSGYPQSELMRIPVSYVASHLTDENGDHLALDGNIVAYARSDYYRVLQKDGLNYIKPFYVYSEDVFVLVDASGVMDFSLPLDASATIEYVRLLIGTPDQLDPNNEFIDVIVTLPVTDYEISAWDSEGNELTVSGFDAVSDSGMQATYYYLDIMPGSGASGWRQGDPIRLRLQPKKTVTDQGVIFKAYNGVHLDENGWPGLPPEDAEEITEMLMDGETGYLIGETPYGKAALYATIVLSNGENSTFMPVLVFVDEASTSITNYPSFYEQNENGSWSYVNTSFDRSKWTHALPPGHSLDKNYLVLARYYDYDGTVNNSLVKKAVLGVYETEEEAAEANAYDVTELLFGGVGIVWNFSNSPLPFTVFDSYGNAVWQVYYLEESSTAAAEVVQKPYNGDVYFRVNDAYDPVYSVAPDTYVMSYMDDSYYHNGYQTLFLLGPDGEAVKGEELQPFFQSGNGARIYASYDGVSGELQKSGASIVPVTYGRPVHYSAAADDGTNLRQYYVTFVTQEEGSHLFVNGVTNSEHVDDETGFPMRVVYLDADHEYHSDILFANFGTEELTGLKVELSDAENIQLDDYWTIRPDSVGTLPPFDKGNPDNYGKIRIVPVSGSTFGPISGKLTISADGVEPATVLLNGTVGNPKITTTVLKSGAVKYVPYSTLIQTNYIGRSTNAISFSVINGSLPDGVILKPNGEVYGVPLETGTFTFTVQASYKEDPSYTATQAYALVVVENTDENVENATDIGYELIDRIPRVITPADYVFHSKGELSEFIAVYLDGRELIQDVEYLLEEGSTKITVLEETFDGEEEGDHTIAAEFRIDGDEDGEMKRVGQNFTLEVGEDEPEVSPVNPSRPPVVPVIPDYNPTPTPEPEPEKPVKVFGFTDVPRSAWFYDDVKWVFDRDLMLGVSENRFDPDSPVDAATVVTVLARTIGVDLTQFANSTEMNLPQDQWYSAAANWATQSGLIDDSFERNKPYSRGQMAVLLYKYFKYIGIDCSQPDPTVDFADADLMTPEQNEAYQVLYKYGIFKGVGNNRMDVYGNTSRAQLAALMHRIKEFIDSKI